MEEIDLDSLLDKSEAPSYNLPEQDKSVSNEVTHTGTYHKPNVNNYNKSSFTKEFVRDGKEKKLSMYEIDTIKPKDIDTTIFDKKGRSFMVHAFKPDNETIEKILKVCSKLIRDGFIFRHDGNQDDDLQNRILSLCEPDGKVESYLPFKKFNENIKSPIISNGYELPYRYACAVYGSAYNERLGKGARAYYASKVQAILGTECDNPIDFLLCYNPNGDERYPKFIKGKPKPDYSNLGTLSFYLRVTDKVEIPVYNFKNNDSITSLVQLIK